MKKFEVVVILDPQKVEGNGEAFSDTIKAYIEEIGAKVTRVKCLELRTFARAIKKHKAGIYWDYVVEAEGAFVETLQDKYRLNATVLRLVVFDFVDGQDDDVFSPKPGHDKLIKEENFQDAYDRDERPFRPASTSTNYHEER